MSNLIPNSQDTRTFSHLIISSELNFKYIQYHCPLSDNIVSHAVSRDVLLALKKTYSSNFKSLIFKEYLQTKYYEMNKVYTISHSNSNLTKDYKVIYRNDYQLLDYKDSAFGTLEYVGENQFLLDNETFPVKKCYHHERQSVVHVMDNIHFRLEIEGLLEGISTPNERIKFMNMDSEDFISYGFRLIIKNGMTKSELEDHIELLQSIF